MSSVVLKVTPLIAGYLMIVAAQTLGPEIVGFLHGPAAKLAAEAPPDDVAPGTPLLELCKGYASHHFDSIGNSLHFSGMTAGAVSVLVGLFGPGLTTLERVVSVLWWTPQWYLYAWVGHFGMQKDVPAVFTYGLTPKSFFSGEFCSVMWVYSGQVFDEKGSILVAPGSTVPWRFNFGIGVAVFVLIGAMTPAGFLWQKAWRASAPKEAGARITSTVYAAGIAAAVTAAAIAAAIDVTGSPLINGSGSA